MISRPYLVSRFETTVSATADAQTLRYVERLVKFLLWSRGGWKLHFGGRVTTGEGGDIVLSKAREVLKQEFPDVAREIEMHVPDEKTRRVGQAVAAASLPKAKK